MNHIRRSAAALATVAGALLTLIATSPAALALRVPPPGGYDGTAQAPPHLAPGHILHQPVHEIPSPIPVHTLVTPAACPAGRSRSSQSRPQLSLPRWQ